MQANSVSVVIPCYNARQYLHETLASVLAQSRRPEEVVVVDDGSTDDSATVAEGFGPPVRVIRQANQGESVARNRGIDEATGEWVAFLDADDVWVPEKLARQAAAVARRPDAVCCFSWFYNFGAVSGKTEIPPGNLDGNFSLLDHLTDRVVVFPSTVMVRRDIAPRFPTWTKYGEDKIFFNDIVRQHRGHILFLPDELAGYRKHSTQQSRHAGYLAKTADSILRWADSLAELGEGERIRVRAYFVDFLLESLRQLKWKRDWPNYWELRRYLTQLCAGGTSAPGLNERIYPPWVYAMKDAADRLTSSFTRGGLSRTNVLTREGLHGR